MPIYNQSCNQDFNKSSHQKNVSYFGNDDYLVPVLNDYKTSERNMDDLRVLAGIFAGTIDVVVTKYNGRYKILANGMYSQFKNPEAMVKVLELADANKNKVVTEEEVSDLRNSLYKYLSEDR